MKLEKNLYQKSYLYFVVFFLFMLWGFWVTYLTQIVNQENYRMHLHGAVLILWCLMLIIQPYLIKAKKVKVHKMVGKVSYILVPLILITTIDLFKYRLSSKTVLTDTDNLFVALILNGLFTFLILYGLAIYNRKKGSIHARFMLSTAFPFFTPITDRIIGIFFPSLLQWLPMVDGIPVEPIYGFAMADLLLIGLSVWDWKSHQRMNIFPWILLLLIGYHISVLYFYKFSFWVEFCRWFLAL